MYTLLNKINSPDDLKNLPESDWDKLAAEIRQKIIEVVSENGGHLAPNLGVVELTLALHLVLDTSADKIVWDVGHQCYTHKLITGRRDQFDTLRQYKGVSGFPRREESCHDACNTGHASTSISYALGLALARDLQKMDHKVFTVIGDGSLTGGMAFEALNHAGHLGTDLVVVLNDNDMSISKNVGALSAHLNRLRMDPMYLRVRENIHDLLYNIPAIGEKVARTAQNIRHGVKYVLIPGMLFEALGFKYLGPFDGHNIKVLRDTFLRVQGMKGPIFVHVITKKGKGYKPAEKNPTKFHGTSPFIIATGEAKNHKVLPNYTEVFGKTIVRLAKEDESIVGITAAMPDGTGLNDFAREFPDRFVDVGIAEQHAITISAGLASQGMKPVTAIYSTFLQRAYDQLIHDVCLTSQPVKLFVDRGGIVGDDGHTHQGIFDLSYLRSIPNLTVMTPKDENEFQHMIKTALEYPYPIALRYPRDTVIGVEMDEELKVLPHGQGEILTEGKDVVILAVGPIVYKALKAAKLLQKKGIQATVVNMRFVKPLDENLLLKLTQKIKTFLTIEENVLMGGFGSGVLEFFQEKGINDLKIKCLALPDEFIEHGTPAILRENYGLTDKNIAQIVCRLVSNKPDSEANGTDLDEKETLFSLN